MRLAQNPSCLAIALCVLCLSLFSAPQPACSAAKSFHDPSFLWAFGALRATATQPKAEPVTSGMVLHTGDKLKMMIRLKNKCFVYLIHKDSQGDFNMLFPYSPKLFDSDLQIERNYYVPQGSVWFQLDNRTGRETFYLIASDRRLLDIEYTYQEYAASKGAKDKRNLAQQMLSQLDAITRKNFASSGQAGLPAPPKSLARGFERAEGSDPTDITGLATEISFHNIYSQTFVIDHK